MNEATQKRLKVALRTNEERFFTEFEDEIKLFRDRLELDKDGEIFDVEVDVDDQNGFVKVVVKCVLLDAKSYEIVQKLEQFRDNIAKIAQIKRIAKSAVYKFVSDALNVDEPYGSLTGIRPTKLWHEFETKGKDADREMEALFVSPAKRALIKEIVDAQKPVYKSGAKEVDLFVNIPICTSRCAYCSFISAELSRVQKQVPRYASLLREEIDDAARLILESGYLLRCIYVGGGTPTSLPDEQFEEAMGALSKLPAREFTVEAGRPDTITLPKLKIMDKTGVTRISVNPQTLNQNTLDAIGRRHTVDEFFAKYELARKFDFDVNVDLIAMLPGETPEMFAASVDGVIALDPENVTVHTLALKKGSALKLGGYDNTSESDAAAMVDYAYGAIKGAGYVPYYMYRQKYMSGNLENVGYCKPGKQCVYNVDIMEETTTIIACGAGGISKFVDREAGRVERYADPKGLDVYLARGEEVWRRRREFFDDCERRRGVRTDK